MMISPNSYIDEHKNDSFEQLINERDSLIEEIRNLEKIVYDNDRSDSAWNIHPGPDVHYQVYLEYLSAICDFIKEKYNTEIVWGESGED